jgi:hypothetical protein
MGHSNSLVCVVCEDRVPIAKGALRIECRCGMEYHVLSGQPVEELICELPTMPPDDAPLVKSSLLAPVPD